MTAQRGSPVPFQPRWTNKLSETGHGSSPRTRCTWAEKRKSSVYRTFLPANCYGCTATITTTESREVQQHTDEEDVNNRQEWHRTASNIQPRILPEHMTLAELKKPIAESSKIHKRRTARCKQDSTQHPATVWKCVRFHSLNEEEAKWEESQN